MKIKNTHIMKLKLTVFALLALFVMSCTSTKDTATDGIAGKHWKLKTLQGKDIMNNSENRDIHFMLNIDEKRVTGFTGCNTFFGEYILEQGNRIKFEKMGSTRMACPDSDFNEQDFLNVLSTADNYTINNGVLSLNVGKRAPLAVFEVVN